MYNIVITPAIVHTPYVVRDALLAEHQRWKFEIHLMGSIQGYEQLISTEELLYVSNWFDSRDECYLAGVAWVKNQPNFDKMQREDFRIVEPIKPPSDMS